MLIATGAYYKDVRALPIQGLGAATDPTQALEALLQSAPVLRVVTPWARQSGPMSYEQMQPTHNYVLMAIDAKIIQEAERIGGGPLPSLAIFGGPQLTLSELDEMTASSPYQVAESLVVYDQTDQRVVPEALSLRWLVLRDADDPYGGSEPASLVAERLAGQLVAIVEQPLTGHERLHPALPPEDALRVQEALPGESAAAVLMDRAGLTGSGWLVAGAVAVAAGLIGYYAYQASKRK